MASPHIKLAKSLEVLKAIQNSGVVAIRSGDLTRTHRERLLKNGFLKEVMKGWYLPVDPGQLTGESTPWYTSFWRFCAAYLNKRFGTNWSLSPEQSLSLHVGNISVPHQLLVRSPKARNKITRLPHNTSLFDTRLALPAAGQVEVKDGLRLFSLHAGLVSCGAGFFQQNPTDVRAALAIVRDASELLALLLKEGRTTVAGRLAGAFRNIGRDRIANDILKTMQAAGFDVREKDPFDRKIESNWAILDRSPYANRLRLMWEKMRKPILERFPPSPGRPVDISDYLSKADDNYIADAYHSLSIEGYRVSPELIERVRSGAWNPDEILDDRRNRDALAARGYWQAYQVVRQSAQRVLEGENPGTVIDEDHGDWYREMFGPSVVAGLLDAADLAGYRSGPVYIRRSMHVPPRHEAVRDCMPVFFDMLREELEPAVRVVLGHFIFVYIHPYTDGNGRIGRFLMNVMLASGGYPWTVVPMEKRDEYMDALESGSIDQEIVPFTILLGNIVSNLMK